MRISDWSSDVCSSDLRRFHPTLICSRGTHGSERRVHSRRRHRQPLVLSFQGARALILPATVDRQQGSRRRGRLRVFRSEEHTSELQSLMRISYAVFCLKKKTTDNTPIYRDIYIARRHTQNKNSITKTHTP